MPLTEEQLCQVKMSEFKILQIVDNIIAIVKGNEFNKEIRNTISLPFYHSDALFEQLQNVDKIICKEAENKKKSDEISLLLQQASRHYRGLADLAGDYIRPLFKQILNKCESLAPAVELYSLYCWVSHLSEQLPGGRFLRTDTNKYIMRRVVQLKGTILVEHIPRLFNKAVLEITNSKAQFELISKALALMDVLYHFGFIKEAGNFLCPAKSEGPTQWPFHDLLVELFGLLRGKSVGRLEINPEHILQLCADCNRENKHDKQHLIELCLVYTTNQYSLEQRDKAWHTIFLIKITSEYMPADTTFVADTTRKFSRSTGESRPGDRSFYRINYSTKEKEQHAALTMISSAFKDYQFADIEYCSHDHLRKILKTLLARYQSDIGGADIQEQLLSKIHEALNSIQGYVVDDELFQLMSILPRRDYFLYRWFIRALIDGQRFSPETTYRYDQAYKIFDALSHNFYAFQLVDFLSHWVDRDKIIYKIFLRLLATSRQSALPDEEKQLALNKAIEFYSALFPESTDFEADHFPVEVPERNLQLYKVFVNLVQRCAAENNVGRKSALHNKAKQFFEAIKAEFVDYDISVLPKDYSDYSDFLYQIFRRLVLHAGTLSISRELREQLFNKAIECLEAIDPEFNRYDPTVINFLRGLSSSDPARYSIKVKLLNKIINSKCAGTLHKSAQSYLIQLTTDYQQIISECISLLETRYIKYADIEQGSGQLRQNTAGEISAYISALKQKYVDKSHYEDFLAFCAELQSNLLAIPELHKSVAAEQSASSSSSELTEHDSSHPTLLMAETQYLHQVKNRLTYSIFLVELSTGNRDQAVDTLKYLPARFVYYHPDDIPLALAARDGILYLIFKKISRALELPLSVEEKRQLGVLLFLFLDAISVDFCDFDISNVTGDIEHRDNCLYEIFQKVYKRAIDPSVSPQRQEILHQKALQYLLALSSRFGHFTVTDFAQSRHYDSYCYITFAKLSQSRVPGIKPFDQHQLYGFAESFLNQLPDSFFAYELSDFPPDTYYRNRCLYIAFKKLYQQAINPLYSQELRQQCLIKAQQLFDSISVTFQNFDQTALDYMRSKPLSTDADPSAIITTLTSIIDHSLDKHLSETAKQDLAKIITIYNPYLMQNIAMINQALLESKRNNFTAGFWQSSQRSEWLNKIEQLTRLTNDAARIIEFFKLKSTLQKLGIELPVVSKIDFELGQSDLNTTSQYLKSSHLLLGK